MNAVRDFKLIDECFPGLIECQGETFYFKNRGISDKQILRSYIGYLELGDNVKLRGYDCNIFLYLEDDPHGELEMDFDFELDQEVCVMLFGLGIRIVYWKDGVMEVYDEQRIKRKFIIDKIIEHE